MIDVLNDQQIEEVLMHQVIGRIGCHANGVTYVVPISYAYDGENIYCHTSEGMKINMMRRNPNVCFEVDELRDIANWKSVIAWGVFHELKDPHLRKAALKKLVDRVLPMATSQTMHLSAHSPFMPDNLDDITGIVFSIQLYKKTGRFETHSIVPSYS